MVKCCYTICASYLCKWVDFSPSINLRQLFNPFVPAHNQEGSKVIGNYGNASLCYIFSYDTAQISHVSHKKPCNSKQHIASHSLTDNRFLYNIKEEKMNLFCMSLCISLQTIFELLTIVIKMIKNVPWIV